MISGNRTNRLALLAVLLLGCAVTATLVSLAWNSEINKQETLFNSRVLSVNEIVSQRVSATIEHIHSLSMFFNASNYVDAGEFSLFSGDYLQRHPFIQSVTYAHLVKKDARSAYEDRMTVEMTADFKITEQRDNGIVTAAERDMYLPVQYNESSTHQAILRAGQDLLQDPLLVDAVFRAFETGDVIKVSAGQDNHQDSYLLLKALFANSGSASGIDAPQKLVKGLLLLRIDATEVLGAIPSAGLLEISLHLESIDSRKKPVVLATKQSESSLMGSVLKWLHSERKVKTPGQSMMLSIRQPVFWRQLGWAVLVSLVITGIMFTAVAGILTQRVLARSQRLQQRNEEIEKVIDKRTKQLIDDKRALAESEQRYRTSVEHAPEAIVVLDVETGLFVDANRKAEQLFGYERAELFKRGPVDVSAPIQANGETADRLAKKYTEEAGRGDNPIFEWLHRNVSGDYIPCEIRLAILPSTRKTLLRASITNISERKRAQAQMGKLSRALERTGDAVIITDRFGVIEYVNPAFEAMSGYSSQEALGNNPNIIKSGKHDAGFYKQLWATLLSGEDFRDVIINRKKDGTIYYEEKTISPLRDDEGKISHYVATGKDITDRIQTQEKLHHLAHHDVLTGLPNRILFIERLTQGILHARRHGYALAVMFLDMDRFKVINDSLGHDTGDQLLQEFGRRLVACVRSSDTVARLGGDEFTILLEDMADPDNVATVAGKVINALSTPFVLDGRELFVTTSIGVSVFPGDGDDVRSMLKNADTAMYRAKELGRNNYQFYSADMSSRALERLAMENHLRRALEKNEFVVHYQPKLDYRTGKIVGAEALIRWQHPEQGLVSPAEFIPLLEETGLIVEVGEWVLKTAVAQSVAWKKTGLPDICMSVNLSARQLVQTGLVDTVSNVISEHGLQPGDLELELTESMIMNNAEKTIETLDAISQLGVRFAVDDFGTGYSSLAYLKRFPIQIIKIDRAFIRGIVTEPEDRSIVNAIIAMSHSLDIDILAEGVETEQQAMLLEQYGCYYMQGFLFSKPLPAGKFAELLRRQCTATEQAAETV